MEKNVAEIIKVVCLFQGRVAAYLAREEASELLEQAQKAIERVWQVLSNKTEDRIYSLRPHVLNLLVRHQDTTTISVSSEATDESMTSILFQLTCKLGEDRSAYSAVTFAIIHVLIQRAHASAIKRMTTIDKEELNRVLDHVAFVMDLVEVHAVLAGSMAYPLTEILAELLEMAHFWRRHASRATQTLVTVCKQLEKPLNSAQIDYFVAAMVGGRKESTMAALQAMQHLKELNLSGRAKIVQCALSYHPVYSQYALKMQSQIELVRDGELTREADIVLELCQRSSLSTCVAAMVEQMQALGVLQPKIASIYRQLSKTDRGFSEMNTVFEASCRKISETITQKSKLFESSDVDARMGLLQLLSVVMRDVQPDVAMVQRWMNYLLELSGDLYATLLNALRVHMASIAPEQAVVYLKQLKTYSVHKKDSLREAAAVLIGTCVRSLEPTNPQVIEARQTLLKTLETPSTSVQIAVSQCLAGLSGDRDDLMREYQSLVFQSTTAIQRGAAYGIAALLEADPDLLMPVLTIIKSKITNSTALVGCMLILECLATNPKFEAAEVAFASVLVGFLGDSSMAIRDAARELFKVMIINVSHAGVQAILEILLSALNTDQWRLKEGVILQLTHMANYRGSAVESALPVVMRALVETLKDTHRSVEKHAEHALYSFGSSVKTPEIEINWRALVEALIDPVNGLEKALKALQVTTFEHYLDPASLALLVPVIVCGLRSTEAKKAATQVLSCIPMLAEPASLVNHLSLLVDALLQNALTDAVETTRTIAANAIGNIVRVMGVVSGLFKTLFNELDNVTGSVQSKAGAAEALSEIIGQLDQKEAHIWMSRIVDGLQSVQRDAYLPFMVYMPCNSIIYGYMPQILAHAFAALRDPVQSTRDVAKRAIGNVVARYGLQITPIYMPLVLETMLDGNKMARLCAVELASEAVKHSKDLSARFLAIVYLLRHDDVGSIRQEVMTIWRHLVANTPRKITELFSVYLELCVEILSRETGLDDEITTCMVGVASRSLADTVSRYEINDLKQLYEGRRGKHQVGVCNALALIINKTRVETQAGILAETMMPTLRSKDNEAGVLAAEKMIDNGGQAVLFKMLIKGLPESLGALLKIIERRPHQHTMHFLSICGVLTEKTSRALLEIILALREKLKTSEMLAILFVSGQIEHYIKPIEALLDGQDVDLDLKSDPVLLAHAMAAMAKSASTDRKRVFIKYLFQAPRVVQVSTAIKALVAASTQSELELYVQDMHSNRNEAIDVVMPAIMHGSEDSKGRGLQVLLRVLKGPDEVSNAFKIAGPIIRILGEIQTSERMRAMAMQAIYELLNQDPQGMRVFLPQLGRIIVKQIESQTFVEQWTVKLGRQVMQMHPRAQPMIDEIVGILERTNASTTSIGYQVLDK